MPTLTFANVTDDGLLFSNISATETGIGTTNSVIGDPSFAPGAISNPPVPPGAVTTGLAWTGFVGGASGPGSSLSLVLEYDISALDPLRAITSIRQNAFTPDTVPPAGAMLLLKQEIFSGSTLVGSSQLTRTFTGSDTQDPPFESGDIALAGSYATLRVVITVEVSIAPTAPAGTSTSFSIMSQSYNSALLPASLGDYVFEDVNLNGIQDAGDVAIAGVTVQLLDTNGIQIGSTTTNGVGFYSFTGLAPGDYSVRFVPPSGYLPTLANQGANDSLDSDAVSGVTQEVTLTHGEFNGTLDAGFFRLAGLGDYVFEDVNQNGIQDAGDLAIAGVTVNLLDTNGVVIGTTTTDGVGHYSFTGLVPGDYSVQFVAPAGYTATFANQGANDAVDSDAVGGVTQEVTLTSGEFDGTLDAGFFKPVIVPDAGLGDYVFEDMNRNGVQDAGDVAISGVTVQLLDGDGNVIDSTITAADGSYGFLGLLPGDYSVRFVTPAGYTATLANQGANDALDSDAVGGVTQEVTLASGEFNGTLDAGFFRPASLGDYVFEDKNRNGVQDADDVAIAGVTVQLLDTNGIQIASTTTDASGLYNFAGLVPGDYSVRFVTPAGYTATLSNQGANDALDSDAVGGVTQEVTLTSGEFNGTLDAGFFRPASLGDFVFEDVNRNGIQDAGDVAIAGVTVNLLDTNGLVIGSTTTSGTGSYSFTGLVPGDYSVQFVTPAGYTATLANQGANDALDSDAVGGVTQEVTLASGEFNGTLDAGFFRPASLGDYVFEDKNRNGVQDVGDVAIAGVTVQLLDTNGIQIASTTTDAAGLYNFAGLVPGDYSVRFVTPAGYTATLANAGASDALDSDAVGGVTQEVTLASGEFNGTLDAGFFKPRTSIDIEKTTAGATNSNPVAADYDNEDAANGAGVPILVAGSAVTWTYKVTNTGETPFARADIAIVDDNGTTGSTADDMTVANGKIVFDSVTVGDADTLLEAGEVWLYKASGIVQNLGTGTGAATTFDFSGSSALDGTDGNVRSYTSGGVSVKASAFSRDTAGAWETGFLGAFGGGLGVTDRGEGDGSGNAHTVDNTGRDNFVLFRFDQQVVVDSTYLGYVVNDSDLRVWIGTLADPYNTSVALNDAVLTGLGFTEVNETTLTTARLADLNAGNFAGNVLVIAANTGEPTTEDNFKIEKLTVKPAGAGGIYENKATVTAPGAVSDSDLSHYKTVAAPAPGLDIEKTTNGPSNSNATAPTYDNEDAANDAGVPILVAGSAVTWTYKVANTGNTNFTRAEIAIVDDNGTTANTADDMTVANGRIVFDSVAVGDADTLLEAGEVWLYKANGTVQNLATPGATATFDFSGSSALDGTDGNVRSYTSGGVSVKASAFSRVDGAGTWSTAWLGAFGGGLGVTDSGEGDGSGNAHTVDNVGRDNYVVFRFDQQVVVDKAYLGYVVGDSDATVWIGNVANAFTAGLTLSDSVLAGLGFTEVNDTTLTTARWADINAGNLAGNVLVVAASTADTTPDDYFKIEKLTVQQLSTSGTYANKATVSAQGVSDSDMSHYKNGAPPVPGIDIEKTTNGPSNSNACAPTYDNEDAANGAGVPILKAGTAVTWTYKVANTGNTTIAASDIAIVDDNGTPGSTADDFTIANGRISLLSKTGGDTDNLLETGEVWTYQATGVVKDLTAWGAATTFDFSGSSALDGTDGNVRSFTSGGISVKANAWSRVDGAGGAWANGYLGSYGGGLGVTDRGEGSGGGDTHTVDNMGGRDNYVLFRFDQQVVVDKAYLGYVVGDSDVTVWIGNITNAFAGTVTLSDAVLTGLGFTEVNDTTLASARWADINAGNLGGNVLVIAASTADTTPDDRFKIDQLVVRKAPDVDVYENKATVYVPGASDSDLSHYTNPDIWH